MSNFVFHERFFDGLEDLADGFEDSFAGEDVFNFVQSEKPKAILVNELWDEELSKLVRIHWKFEHYSFLNDIPNDGIYASALIDGEKVAVYAVKDDYSEHDVFTFHPCERVEDKKVYVA